MEISQTIRKLFVSRDDTYAKQGTNGYVRIEDTLSDEVILSHLKGESTIGTYQFGADGKIKWICFDFDGVDLDEQLGMAKRLYLKLRDDEKIKSVLLEFSGKKGYHIWVFCKPIDGASAKIWAEEISEGYGAHEIFPKQSSIGDKFGNLVKIPLGIHKISGKRSFIFGDTLEELDQESSLMKLNLMLDHLHEIPRIVVKEIVRTVRVGGPRNEVSPFIQGIIKNGVKDGERHKYRFIVTKELYNAGYQPEEIISNVLAFNKNCSPPEDILIAEHHVRKLLEYPERYLAKEVVSDIIRPEDLLNLEKLDFKLVLKTYKKWMYLEDDTVIDMFISVALTRKEQLSPIWIIAIAPSGSGKSEILRPLEDKSLPSTTEVMSKITKNTFLSGIKDDPDFAQTLKNTPKLFLTYDFAQFVKLKSEDKAQIWAQLRDIYDGFIEKKAAGMVNKKVDGIKVNWLICSTPIVDSELLIQQELGTRELLYRFKYEDIDEETLMSRIWENSDKLDQMRKELSFIVRKFIEKKEAEGFRLIEIPDNVKKDLMNMSLMIATLRAATESDSYTGELTNFVYKEMPTRVLLQLKSIYLGLKNLADDYPDHRALKIIKRIALSSIHPIRLRILLELGKNNDLSTTDIQKKLNIGWKTVITQLYTARQLGLVDYREDDYATEDVNKAWKKKMWHLMEDNEVVTYLKDNSNIINEIGELYG